MLLKLCYKIVDNWNNKNRILYKLIYKTCKVILNLFFPIIYKNREPEIEGKTKYCKEVVVSFTSFPARIEQVWMTAYTLLNQTVRPDHLILWLADSQFRSLEDLPYSLKRLKKYGLEIELCEDLKSHKKYYYALEKYPNAILVTADDDIFYPPTWLEGLLEKHNRNPEAVCCNWAHRITLTDGRINSYEDWEKCIENGADEASDYIVQIGYAGVLYPPGALDCRVLDKEKIIKLCLSADDLWLKAMTYMNGTKVICVNNCPTKLFGILSMQKSALYKVNVGQNLNDVAIRNILHEFSELEKFA